MAADAHLPHHVGHCMRTVLLHEICGDVVGTLGKSPFQGHGLAYPLVPVRTLRCPCGVLDKEGLRHIHHLVARGHALLHGKGIKERLDGRTHLTLALTHIVIFEISVVRSSDICLHMARVRLDGHERGTQMRLVISYGIVRGHDGVYISLPVPREHPHLGRDREAFPYFRFGRAFVLHDAVAVAPAPGLFHEHIHGSLVHIVRKRLVLLPPDISPEAFLQVFSKMLRHCLFCIFLHLVVDGGIYA